MSFSLIINDFKKVGHKGEDVSHEPSRRIYFFKAHNEHSSSWEINLIMYLEVEEEENTEEKEKCTLAHKQ